MIALFLMLAVSQAGLSPEVSTGAHPSSAKPSPRQADAAVPSPPGDWSQLPALKLRRARPGANAVSIYVRDEVRAGRCDAASPLRVDIAVLVAASGRVRGIRPNAIGCPTVEQYASGLVMRMARGNVPPPPEDQWYRISLTFAWQ